MTVAPPPDREPPLPEAEPAGPDAAPVPDAASWRVRPARPADLPALVSLEAASFSHDRLSRRSLQRLLKRPSAMVLVAEATASAVGKDHGAPPALGGYVLVLMREGSSLARLYSLAIDPACRGQGLGRCLLTEAEAAARARGGSAMRLEVRPDNAAAIALYRSAGYREFAVFQRYYEDLSDALRFSKSLIQPDPSAVTAPVPLYRQGLPFTCGAACLMMAMHALDSASPLDEAEEIRLWREATTIFMTSGHGGCGPHGLALAAHRRGFAAEVVVSDDGPLFVDGVRDPKKRAVLRLVHADFVTQCQAAGIPIRLGSLSADDLASLMAQGAVPIVLISQYRLWREKAPHWVVVCAVDAHCIHVNDPDVDLTEETASSLDCLRLPIPRRDFEAMARFGRARLRAAVVLRRLMDSRFPCSTS